MSDTDEKKSNKIKKSSKKVNASDKMNILFFIILIIGLILFTFILLIKSNEKTYIAEFNDNITSTVKLSGSNKVEITVKVQDVISCQTGTYKEITDDDINNNYQITLDENSEKLNETISMIVEENTLKLIYEDGSEIDYKEK